MSTVIHFHKMHGLGNDFVIIDGVRQNITLTPEQICFIADRHLGIGCDQVLIVEKSKEKDIDFDYRIYNADGSESGQCGNGARCLAQFVNDTELSNKKQLRVKTSTTILTVDYQNNEKITVDMGAPQNIRVVEIKGMKGIALSLGNPHVVFVVENLATQTAIQEVGAFCQTHSLFPEGVNVGFMEIINPNRILLRVYERGAGETLACGSGACAAVVAGIYQQLLSSPVAVQLTYGELLIQWPTLSSTVLMTGPAVTVFRGEILLV